MNKIKVTNQSNLSIDSQILISRKGHKGKTQIIAKLGLITIYELVVFEKDLAVLQKKLYKIMIMRYLKILI
ncbi:hypothetical protein [Flavobacteriaceae bacterium 14752]|uniref:hypothetical protein n=1 Tax=Mesohalobacter salilacus TaxID=2491711 RepID=UPI000F631A26|nr:hypothetical protein EIG84_04825 [Flavobacteriaceae bacterium 14752]